MNVRLIIPRFSLLSILLSFLFHSLNGQDQMPVQQSFQTIQFLLPEQTNALSEEETEVFIDQLADRLEYWNSNTRESDPGWKNDILKPLAGYAVDELVDISANSALSRLSPLSRLPVRAAGGCLNDKINTYLFEKDAKEYARERDFKVRETFELTATAIVEDHCLGDVDCAEAVFNQVLNDPDVQKQISEADALGAFDEAQTRAYVKNAQEKSMGNYEGTIVEIDNLATTVKAAVSDVKTTLISNFQEVNDNQHRIISHTAEIMHVQQENTIALAKYCCLS